MCGYEVSCSQIDDNLTINILLPPMGLFAFCSILFHGTLMPIWFENWLGLSISFLTGNIYMTPRNPKRRGGGKLRKLRLMLYLCYTGLCLCSLSLWRGSFSNGDGLEKGLRELQESILQTGISSSEAFGYGWLVVELHHVWLLEVTTWLLIVFFKEG